MPRQIVRKNDRQRHQFFRIATRIAEHHALIARSDAFEHVVGMLAGLGLERFVHAHRDVGGLLVDGNAHAAGLRIESDGGLGIADVFNHAAHDTRNVDVRGGRDLAGDVNLPRDCERFARNAAVWIVFENSIQHCVRNLIGDFVRMTLRHRFAGKQSTIRHCYVPSLQEAMYLICCGVSVSISTFMDASFSLATSSSMCSGTSYTFFSRSA